MSEPRTYDFRGPIAHAEIVRWAMEVRGYLRSDPGTFARCGTDKAGRAFAVAAAHDAGIGAALEQLRFLTVAPPPTPGKA